MLRFALLLFVFSLHSQFALAQLSQIQRIQETPGNFDRTDLQLHYYLLQAFHADSAAERTAINHIGVQTSMINGDYVVTAVLEGYPAHGVGINHGDKLVAVDGKPYHPIHSFNQATLDFRGLPVITELKLSYEIEIERNGDRLATDITTVYENFYDSYRTATLNSVQQFSVGSKVIGYVRFWGLSRNSNDLIAYRNIIEELRHCDGLIIDLRNSYGFLDESLLDLFFSNRNRYFNASGPGSERLALDLTSPVSLADRYLKPIAVLTNSATLGGAELFAYQLNKLERVDSIGEFTAGRIGQYQLEKSGLSSSFRYEPATELTIDGEIFEAKGLQPERVVNYPTSQSTRSDPQFQNAINTLTNVI